MSDFGNKFAAQGIVKLLNRLGDSITYTTLAGSSTTRTAVFDVLDEYGESRRGVFVMASDAATGVASPVAGDKITDASALVWTIVDVRPDGAGCHELLAHTPKLNT